MFVRNVLLACTATVATAASCSSSSSDTTSTTTDTSAPSSSAAQGTGGAQSSSAQTGGAGQTSSAGGTGGSTSSASAGGAGGSLASNGTACSDKSECASGFCVDKVCCESACDGKCEKCNASMPGLCEPTKAGESENKECSVGVCDGAKACSLGNALWNKHYPGDGNDNVRGLALDSKGEVVIAGYFSGTLKFGNISLGGDGDDVFVAKVQGAQTPNMMDGGTPKWAKSFGSGGGQYAVGVAVDVKDDSVVVGGHFQNSVNFGGGSMGTAGGSDLFVAKLDKDGGYKWQKSFGSGSSEYVEAITVDKDGGVYIAGSFSSKIVLGGGIELNPGGGEDAFVVKLDSAGVVKWAKAYGDGSNQTAVALASDLDGNLLVGGKFAGKIDFGKGPISAVQTADLFVAKLEPMKGDAVWAKGYATKFTDPAIPLGIATGPNNEIAVATEMEASTVDVGGTMVKGAGDEDILIFKLDKDGKTAWASAYGKNKKQAARRTAIDSSGNIMVTGETFGDIDWGLGDEPFTALDGDVFVAKFSSGGKVLYGRNFGSVGNQYGRAVAVEPKSRDLVLAADFDDTLAFALGNMVTTKPNDIAVVRFAP